MAASALKIEKNVPVSRARAANNGEFHAFLKFCQDADVGDSALLVGAPSNYRMAALISQVWLQKQFTFGKDGKQFRVWRIK